MAISANNRLELHPVIY